MSKAHPAGVSARKDTNNTSKPKTNNGLGVDASGLSETLQGHVDDIRTLLQCGICIRPLYEPFTIACGHTFCYSCLTSWFAGGRSNKTCPDCRAPVKSQPAPAYLIRTLVQLFTSRAELLDKGETTAEHANHQREEAEKVDTDKKNTHPREGGLFRGTFSKARAPPPQPIVDLEDNVVRCPHCSWELEEGTDCTQCGYHQDMDSFTGESDYMDEDDMLSEMTDYMDDEYEDAFGDVDVDDFWGDLPDAFPVELASLWGVHGIHRHNGYPSRPQLPYAHAGYDDWPSLRAAMHDSLDEEEEEGEDEDEDDGEMDSFIDDDSHLGEGDYSESDRSTVVGAHEYSMPDHGDDHAAAPYPPSISDSYISSEITATDGEGVDVDEDEDEDPDDDSDEDDDDDDDDDEPVRPAVGGNRRRRLPSYQVVSSSPAFDTLPSRNASFSLSHSASTRLDRRPQQTPSAGTSVSTAIHVDDESDEGPIGPVRRTRERGNCRRRIY